MSPGGMSVSEGRDKTVKQQRHSLSEEYGNERAMGRNANENGV